MEAYRARPPYQRNDYLGWITRAKLPETRSRRLKQMLEELEEGTHYMNMRWRAPRDRLLSDRTVHQGSGRALRTIDQYISAFSHDVQPILRRIRQVVRSAAPDAQEGISYRMPAFRLNGPLVYFAAFKKHIGLYPPVKGDPGLQKAVSRYAGPKGNLQFQLDQPIPYALIARITKSRARQNLAKARARTRKSKA